VTQHSRDTPQFYLTAPSPCPYLPGRHERKVFTHLVGDKAGDLNDLLTHGGFRRSQSIAYRPACDQCRACVSVRVIANEFRPSRNFRKILARNADIVGEQRSAMPTSEQYSVFRAYLDHRHRHGGMADMTVLDYAMMVEDSHVETRIIEYRKRGIDSGITGRGEGLVAVALSDVLSDGLSMVYSFFEPSEESRSLGTFMILDHIARARRLGLPYVYLGYWIEGSKKMDYKGRFLPQQRLAPSGCHDPGRYGDRARHDEIAHLAPVRDEPHQRNHRERQLHRQDDLTENQQMSGAAFAVERRDDDHRHDGDGAGHEPAGPARHPQPQKTFHDDLPCERRGHRRVEAGRQ
jgi:arginine-tRNA-protein transferase